MDANNNTYCEDCAKEKFKFNHKAFAKELDKQEKK
jgi:hypothetical protein